MDYISKPDKRMGRTGYACINLTLQETEKVTVNRSCIRATWDTKGLSHVSKLALQNIKDLRRIIQWNGENNIHAYRMSSDMFPWMSEYMLEELPDWPEIKDALQLVGRQAMLSDVRLSYHPGQFCVLASPTFSIVDKAIWELTQHGNIMDYIGLPRDHRAKINIHIGGAYGDKQSSLERWIKNYNRLPDQARLRLTVENDDKPNMYSVQDLMYVHEQTGIPIVYDYLHDFCHESTTEEQRAVNSGNKIPILEKFDEFQFDSSFMLAYDTWPEHITPTFHYSDSKALHEDNSAKLLQHADHIYRPVPTFGRKIDIMFESKAKEKALLRYMQQLHQVQI